ncbi:MAG: capsular polysaccharide transport system permease protein [Campylobacterota bacterium]|nr:capsular polysaccharide transport system permease protein [Campylobacterota bacterium]MDQ1337280.1 capsular polysaccharide transport system permease protein [Campylobacterota bacterium]
MGKKLKKFSKMQIIFFSLFVILSVYYMVLRTELYESRTSLLVKDTTSSAPADSMGLSLLGIGSSSQVQDTKVVEEYLKSLDMYQKLDEKFGLSAHYKSDKLDFVQRRFEDAKQEDFLKFYNSHLNIVFDETSSILQIAFSHSDAATAQKILEFLVAEVEEQINELNRKNAQRKLSFIEQEYAKAKIKMDTSSKILEEYQNKNLLLDPSTQATATTGIISNLEATLTQKKIEYATMQTYLNEESYELRSLKNEIEEIEKSIAKQKEELSGDSKNRLNKVLFEYEKLKLQSQFDTEVYKNALLQLETTKLDVSKEAKMLSIISKPNLPDGYTYPDKPKVFITILILTLLMYGIFSMLNSIIKDHKE